MSKYVKLVFAAFLMVGVIGIFSAPAYASSTPSSSSDCHARVVKLNGTTSTSTCIQTEAQYKAKLLPSTYKQFGLTPNISGGNGCSNGNALWIYQNINYGGACIAFIGAGTAFLYNYLLNSNTSWDEQASSFFSGCANGAFGENYAIATDLLYGHGAYFNAFSGGNFPYSDSNGTVRNDALSEIVLNDNC